MSITDELREYATNDSLHYCSDYLAIADRIDAEHERGMADAYLSGTPTDEQMAEHGWVRLPLDADGEPIRVGDVMEYPNGGREEVRFMTLNGAGWLVNEAGWFPVKLHHHHEPTVEDVLREFAERVCNSGHRWGLDAADTIAEYAAKLRLAGDAE